jgi:hypothetical protein
VNADNGAAAALDALAKALAPHVAREVVALLREESAGMIDQSGSPLGRKRHCAIVRARVGAGTPGAAIVGRRHLLSKEALDFELAALSKRKAKPAAPPVEAQAADDLAPYLERYGVQRTSVKNAPAPRKGRAA